MTSDVDNLTTFYANLPSIFEIDFLSSNEPSSDITATIIDHEKTYRPMFGSFLFTESEPFTRAAFAVSTSPSSEVQIMEEQRIDENSTSNENNSQITPPPPLAPAEDISDIDDDDEDDFDGIPIRHASTMINKKLNGDSDHHSEHNNLLDKIIYPIENNNNENDADDEEELFLNGFSDEQQRQNDTITIPSLFKNIPDIDDLNEQDYEDNDRIPFDHDIDMFDESDSIRSPSPDSLLSSSHLRDDDEDEELNNNEDDDDDDVAQWNDDLLLGKVNLPTDRPNVPLPPPILLNIHSHDQVDFIDSSRSNSRCSNATSHLSIGYDDQERIFLNDDELVTSSDSDSDHEDNDNTNINFKNDLLNRYDSEEPTLEINLDYHRSRASLNSPNISTRSTSAIPDQSPIVAIDEDINEIKSIQSAPIAIVDDDVDDIDDDDLQTFTSDEPVLPIFPLRNLIQIKTEKRQSEIVHDIIDMRHILNDHDNDDEFVAIMHNPSVFEDTLYDDHDEQVNFFLLIIIERIRIVLP